MSVKTTIVRVPILGRVLLIVYRLRLALSYLVGPLWRAVRWAFTARETTNLTYDLTTMNRRYLAAMVSDVTGAPIARVLDRFVELEQDGELSAHISAAVERSARGFMAEPTVRFGRRLAWYALVRELKPRVVVETGVDKGLGSCVLAAALRRNAAEGSPGHYYGTDINPAAGYLLDGPYREHGEILYGDSLESLAALDVEVDLFVNDSDHSAEYEAREYRLIDAKLAADALVVGDNAHATDALLTFAEETGRRFVFCREQPRDHWYAGSGIGIAQRRPDR